MSQDRRDNMSFPHPVYSHNSRRKRHRKYVHDCKYWPFNQRPDLSKHAEICKARREIILNMVPKPDAVQARMQQWTRQDAEIVLDALHDIDTLITSVQPQQDRTQLTMLIKARAAVDKVAGRLIDYGMLPRVPISTMGLIEYKPKTEEDEIKQAVESLIEETKGSV
jgi:hypothetical protein